MFFNSRFPRPAVASSLLAALMTFSLMSAPQADALTLKGTSVTDCGKGRKAICTKYYSREQTESFHNQFQTWQWKTMRVLDIPYWIRVAMHDNDSIGDMVSAARAATLHDGCLQLAYRKNQRDAFEWGYTTHPNYCWDK